jgi:hypothetical protein
MSLRLLRIGMIECVSIMITGKFMHKIGHIVTSDDTISISLIVVLVSKAQIHF